MSQIREIHGGGGRPPYPRPLVSVEPGNFAHGVWQALAVTLAEPLRKAFDAHADRCERCQAEGAFHCEEGVELLTLLPYGDYPLAIALG